MESRKQTILEYSYRNIVKALRYKTGDFRKISEDPQSRFDESDEESEDETDEDDDVHINRINKSRSSWT